MSATTHLEKTTLTLGFIPLTDCAPLVIAEELGYFAKYGSSTARRCWRRCHWP